MDAKISHEAIHFNSHPHEEDDYEELFLQERENISTHILTRRMTSDDKFWHSIDAFQLTSSRGG